MQSGRLELLRRGFHRCVLLLVVKDELEASGRGMGIEMIDADERPAGREREGLCRGRPDEQRADQSRRRPARPDADEDGEERVKGRVMSYELTANCAAIFPGRTLRI